MTIAQLLACSSCFSGEDAARWAYYISAVAMFLLPIIMVSGTFRFLERLVRVQPGALMTSPKKSRPVLFAATLIGAFMLSIPFIQPDMAPRGVAPPTGTPPVLSTVGDFSLTDQSGQSYGSEQLKGKVWVANFIFTRCPTLCPRITERMAEFEAATKDLATTRIVSFSVDPEFDTPPVLAKYSTKYHANTKRWHFVTGPFTEIKTAVEKGLNVTIADARHTLDLKKHQDISTVLHGTRFVLIDHLGRIRGYYDVKLQAAFDQLAVDLRALVAAAK